MSAATLGGLIDTLVAARHAGGYRYDFPEGVLRQFAGSKTRRVPVMNPTAQLPEDYLSRRASHPGVGKDADPLFNGPVRRHHGHRRDAHRADQTGGRFA